MNVIERWLRRAFVGLGLVLLKEAAGTADGGFVLLAGSGVPSGATYGGQTLATGQKAIAFNADATSIDAQVYITIDGGTTWTALKPASSAWYTGTVTTPAADSAAGVAAREEDNVALGAWAGPFTSPVVPRNVSITFEAAWAGGDVTVVGTDQFGTAISEVIADSAGSTVYGTKVFATVTGATNELVGAGGVNHGATIGWAHKLGITKAITAVGGQITCDDVDEAAVWDRTYSAFTPTTLPNGAHTFRWAVIG